MNLLAGDGVSLAVAEDGEEIRMGLNTLLLVPKLDSGASDKE